MGQANRSRLLEERLSELVIRNADVLSLELGVPEGHRHLRATLRLADGTSLVLQEATVANLVRAYIGVVTHPTRRGVRLSGGYYFGPVRRRRR